MLEWNARNVHLWRFSAYLSTKWYLKEMLDITFQIRNVRRVSSIVFGIDLIYSGAIYRIRIARNVHLYQFPMYLSTNGTWWKCRIIDSGCELWDEFLAYFLALILFRMKDIFNGNIVQKSARELMHSVKWYGLICLKNIEIDGFNLKS